MLIRAYGMDMHVNPNYIVSMWKTVGSETYYFMNLYGESDRISIDKESYDLIVEWMERHDV